MPIASDPETLDTEERPEGADRRLTALKDLELALESTMSLDEVLGLAVERTTRIMGAERTTIFLADQEGGLTSRAIQGDEMREISLSPGQGIAGWVARHGRPLVVPDAYSDERFDPEWDRATGFETRAVACHPLVGRHANVIGVVEVLNKVEGRFDGDDLVLLGLISERIALMIENSRLVLDLVRKNRDLADAKIDLERLNRELNLVIDLERLVGRAEDLDSLAGSVLGLVFERTSCEVGVLYRADEAGAESRVVERESPLARVIRVEPGGGFSGWVAAKGEELLIDEPKGDPRFTISIARRIGVPLRNLAAVPLPLGRGSRFTGSILVANKRGAPGFDEHDMDVLRTTAAHLARAMEHLTGREARERERRLATVGRLLAGVLHDLKSPITVVSGYTELLAAKCGDAEAEEYSNRVQSALQRMSAMTEDIIAFSRGERRVLVQSASLKEFVDAFVEQISPQLAANGVDLRTHVRTSGTARLDTEKVLRAFNNIVMNAIEAMPGGGAFTIEVDQLGDELVFAFTDTGGGIPEEIQGTLFDSFVSRGKEHGTGLGLAVAREIVEAHGGTIDFTTVRGGGTTFLISLPL